MEHAPRGCRDRFLIGHISLNWFRKRWFVRAALSLISLCLGVAAWGFALSWLQGGGRPLSEVYLWPLAWLNHEALWSLSGIRDREPRGDAALNLSSDS